MYKYLTVVLVFLIVSSCFDKTTNKPENLDKKASLDTIVNEKVVNESKIEKDTLSRIVKAIFIGDSITVVISRDFIVPVTGELQYDSSFYYIGAYLTIFNQLIDNHDTIRLLTKKGEAISRIRLGSNPVSKYGLKIETFNFNVETPYDFYLVIEMIGASDIIETSLIGLKNDKFEMVFQERAINIRQAIIKDSILVAKRKFYEFTDTLKLNIYTKEKEYSKK